MSGSRTVDSQPVITGPQPATAGLPVTEVVQDEPVHFAPPGRFVRPKKSITRRILLGGFGTVAGWEHKTQKLECARAPKDTTASLDFELEFPLAQLAMGEVVSKTGVPANEGFQTQPYVVVGLLSKHDATPREVLLPIGETKLFQTIRQAQKRVRGTTRSLLSLQKIDGFTIYRCHAGHGYHSTCEIDGLTKRSLDEMYRDYKSGEPDHGDRWAKWIDLHFNKHEYRPPNPPNGPESPNDPDDDHFRSPNATRDPLRGEYALQLVLRWSPLKFLFWGIVPVLLSLAIGFWYQYREWPADVDQVAVTQTAWTIAAFIITTAALIIAVGAAITQVGDI